jgi:AsmA protein
MALAIVIVLALLFLAPYLFPKTVSEKIKELANHTIKGELNFSDARLSFFEHFPSFTFTLNDISLKGSEPYPHDTLIAADKISLGINLRALLFEKRIDINKIFLSNASIHVKINEQGLANYNVYQAAAPEKTAKSKDTSTSLRIEKIVIRNSHLIYSDLSAPLFIDAMGFNYTGNGDLTKEIFDLHSHLDIDSINFVLNQNSYLLHKKINADLLTKINTNSLDFLFEKNNLKINQLSMAFEGRLNFLKNGYFFDISLKSNHSDLHDFITALPPGYLAWLQKTRVKGEAEFSATFHGNYVVSENRKPRFSCSLKLKDGYIAYDKAPLPIDHAHLDFSMDLPSLNLDSLNIRVDSISFRLGKDYLNGQAHSVGFENPSIDARLYSKIDLENLDRTLGIGNIRWKGELSLALKAKGKFLEKKELAGIRKKEVWKIQSIPSFNLNADWKNGYLKHDSLSYALDHLNLRLEASCPNQDYKNLVIRLDTLTTTCAKSFIRGSGTIGEKQDNALQANFDADVDLSDIKKSIPVDSLYIDGRLIAHVHARGKYNPARKLFPGINAMIDLQKGRIQTKYYPHPIQNINMHLEADDGDGTLSGLSLHIPQVAFEFEGSPCLLEA